MAVKRNGLGKGLDSLIPDRSDKSVKKACKAGDHNTARKAGSSK